MKVRLWKRWPGAVAALGVVAVLSGCAAGRDSSDPVASRSIQSLEMDGATYKVPASLTGLRGSLLAIHAASSGEQIKDADRTTILYQSLNSLGENVAVSGALFTPKGPAPEGGWPIVSWAHGTVGVADRCAPSQREDMAYPSYARYVDGLIHAGYAVAATDYVGLGTPGQHTYMNAVDQGNAVADIVTAARQFEPRLSQGKWFAAGHSQGGAAALEATRAGNSGSLPEGLAATIAIAPGNDLGSALTNMASGSDAYPARSAYVAFLLSGLAATDASFDPSSILSSRGKEFVATAQDLCLFDDSAGGKIPSPQSLLSGSPDSGTWKDASRRIAEYGDPDKTATHGPVLVVTGDADLDVPTKGTLAMVANLKRLGAQVDELVVPGEDHEQPVLSTLCPQLRFLSQNGGVDSSTVCAR